MSSDIASKNDFTSQLHACDLPVWRSVSNISHDVERELTQNSTLTELR
jgi:hypothetical protein